MQIHMSGCLLDLRGDPVPTVKVSILCTLPNAPACAFVLSEYLPNPDLAAWCGPLGQRKYSSRENQFGVGFEIESKVLLNGPE